LPFSGKTTLFQTITQTQIDQSSFRKETNQAIVKVPDSRLDKLTSIFNPKKKVNATIEFVDLVGVQKTDKASSMFNSQFISKVRTNDAFLHVVRAFDDPSVPHPNLSIDVERDIRLLEDEFFLNDMAFLESRFEKLEKDMMKQKNKDDVKKELEIMKKWHSSLESGIP
jgi:ribosome-binding ATPase YchF (GTP1/OBG family)